MAKETKETGGKIDQFLETNNHPLKGIVLRTTRTLSDKEGKNPASTTVHNFLVANDQTSTLYVSSFESPSAEWPEAWEVGEKIVEQMGILSNH